MELRIATTQGEREAWDVFCARTETPPLNRSAWLTALEVTYGVSTACFLVEEDGEIVGGCPIYIVRDAQGRRRLYSLRFGLTTPRVDVRGALRNAIRTYAATHDLAEVTVTSGFDPLDGDAAFVKQAVALDVPAGADVAWASLRNKTRNMVRKAERAGLRIAEGTQHLDAFYGLYAARMLRKGVSIHPRAFFTALLDAFRCDAALLIAMDAGTAVGGMILCVGPRAAAYPFQVSRPGTEHLAPTPFLTWEAMRRCAERGIPLLDMGESRAGGAVEAAKRNLGGTSRAVHYAAYAVRSGVDARVQAAFTMRAATFGMRYAPFGIAARCGVWMRRHGRII